ncbi:MAG: hypothetical protein MK080_08435 [Opitutales bacterium]|nr:hypothetical protein [Opitutales bacterium]NRA25968.1 hypothetical protein [Opitutales bacterium]
MRLPLMLVIFFMVFNPAWAVKPLDLRKRESVLSKHSFNTKEAAGMDRRSNILNERFSIKDWSKRYSPLGNRRSAIQATESKEKNVLSNAIYDRELARISTDQTAMTTDEGAFSTGSRNRFDNRRARRFDEARVIQETDLGVSQWYAVAEEISMRDINRYQFRSSREDEPLRRTPVNESEE